MLGLGDYKLMSRGVWDSSPGNPLLLSACLVHFTPEKLNEKKRLFSEFIESQNIYVVFCAEDQAQIWIVHFSVSFPLHLLRILLVWRFYMVMLVVMSFCGAGVFVWLPCLSILWGFLFW
jgi:hypothetical protein